MARIALIGDHDPAVTAHRAIPLALARATDEAHLDVRWDWVGTTTLDDDAPRRLEPFDALWCVPASPYASTSGTLAAIRFARESGRPFLGTCGGFQHVLLEYAQHVWGLEAAHAELDPVARDPIIAPLSCSLVEQSGMVVFLPGSRLAAISARAESHETYHCRYGLSPHHAPRLETGPLRVAARDTAGEVRAIELGGHPFFVATLYQPERAALVGQSHPLIAAFVAAAEHYARAR